MSYLRKYTKDIYAESFNITKNKDEAEPMTKHTSFDSK